MNQECLRKSQHRPQEICKKKKKEHRNTTRNRAEADQDLVKTVSKNRKDQALQGPYSLTELYFKELT